MKKTLLYTALTLLSITIDLYAKAKEPNVIVIYVDDLGYGDLSCQGATKVQTPNIDKLAAEGRRFTDAHSASAVCSPSRYALLTGEYPFRSGSWGAVIPTSRLIVDTETLTVGKVFQNKGYATACIGKWHLGFGNEKTNDWSMPLKTGPNQVGFDYYWGVPLVNSFAPFVYVENDMIVGHDEKDPIVFLGYGKNKKDTDVAPSPTPAFSEKAPNCFGGALKAHELYDDEKTGTLLTEKATDWISKNKKNPFFLYFATTNIHHPFTPAKRFQGTSQAGIYGDYIHELDWMVGEIVKSLEKNKLTKNTLIVLTSDNGGMINLGGQEAVRQGHKMNGDLLGFKFGVWEGGHRIPFIAKWPGKIPAGSTSDQLICSVDMLATFVALTKQENELSLKGKDSKNILEALTGNTSITVREELVLAPSQTTHLSLRKGDWMYIPAQGSGGFKGTKVGHHTLGGPAAANYIGSINSDMKDGHILPNAPQAQLYNLKKDKYQTVNVYNEHPDIVEQMKANLERLKKRPSAQRD